MKVGWVFFLFLHCFSTEIFSFIICRKKKFITKITNKALAYKNINKWVAALYVFAFALHMCRKRRFKSSISSEFISFIVTNSIVGTSQVTLLRITNLQYANVSVASNWPRVSDSESPSVACINKAGEAKRDSR